MFVFGDVKLTKDPKFRVYPTNPAWSSPPFVPFECSKPLVAFHDMKFLFLGGPFYFYSSIPQLLSNLYQYILLCITVYILILLQTIKHPEILTTGASCKKCFNHPPGCRVFLQRRFPPVFFPTFWLPPLAVKLSTSSGFQESNLDCT